MVLVIMGGHAIGRHEVEPIDIAPIGEPYGDTAGEGGIQLPGHAKHPAERGAVGRLGDRGRLHHEPRVPHLGQHVEVAARCGEERSLEALMVLRSVGPDEVLLYKRYVHPTTFSFFPPQRYSFPAT